MANPAESEINAYCRHPVTLVVIPHTDSGALLTDRTSLKARIEKMRTASEGATYFALTLTANEDGHVMWSTQSEIAGITETSPRRELRTACPVIGSKMLALWRDVGTPGVAVNCREDLAIYLHLGGNAIIGESLAREYFPDIFKTREFVPTGLSTKTQIENVDPSTLRKAPTPKLRMKILKRDNYRCRICGRRAEDYTDIELHVHHFRPWAMGGLTEETNLVTLCHTCHNGLDPHFDMSLANVFPETHQRFNELVAGLDSYAKDFFEGVKRYREAVRMKRVAENQE